MNPKEEKILNELQNFPENKMTKEIIIPLLESLGYFKVEFNGGTDEHGKDIICWENDKFNELQVTVAQVKHYKLTGSASSTRGFQTVYNQLSQCFSEKITFIDKTRHIPKEAILISTHNIDYKIFKQRISGQIWSDRVKVIDGQKLVNLLIDKRPDLVKTYLGLEIEIVSSLKSTLNNEVLLKSIGYFEPKSIKHIYTDIDFSLGKKTTQLFFNSSFTPKVKSAQLKKEDWILFKDQCYNIGKIFDLNFLDNSISEYENIARDELKKKNEKKSIYQEEDYEDLIYKIVIDGDNLSIQLNDKKNWIEDKAKEINKSNPEVDEISSYIKKCNEIFNCAKLLLSDSNIFFSSLFESDPDVVRTDFESTRIKLPLEKIFNTGQNISILGEAGAGKTTCLQMYAVNNQNNQDKLIVYLPLSQVINLSMDKELAKNSDLSKLEFFIIKYLKLKGVEINDQLFKDLISNNKVTLLLDGIDEVIKIAPWLIEDLKSIEKTYKESIQVITSSRTTGKYFDNIPYFNITLLPFTNEQKFAFINSWLGEDNVEKSEKIRLHLEKHTNLNELVNNPLLTTLLCVIAEHDLPLPNSELKLYNDRLDLLTGYYDNMKRISRITTSPETLKLLAKKLAYYLHNAIKREADIRELEDLTIKVLSHILNEELSKNALKELIDPCNLLVPMTEDGKYGFGHLRFQEHLASMELLVNRNIDITTLINQPWWRSVLMFFSSINDDLTWFIRELCTGNNIKYSKREIIDEMIKKRPSKEQSKLKGIIKKYDLFEEHKMNKR